MFHHRKFTEGLECNVHYCNCILLLGILVCALPTWVFVFHQGRDISNSLQSLHSHYMSLRHVVPDWWTVTQALRGEDQMAATFRRPLHLTDASQFWLKPPAPNRVWSVDMLKGYPSSIRWSLPFRCVHSRRTFSRGVICSWTRSMCTFPLPGWHSMQRLWWWWWW